MIGIYTIINKINGKQYVGSAIDCKVRLQDHFSFLRRNKHYNKYLQNAFNKYGIDNFETKILEEVVDKNKLVEREQFWIDFLRSAEVGYNLRKIANSNVGLHLSEETKLKIGLASRNRKHSEETKLKISKALTGIVRSEKTRKKLSAIKKGIPKNFTPTQLIKVKEGAKIGGFLGGNIVKNSIEIRKKISEKVRAHPPTFSKELLLKFKLNQLNNKYALGYKHTEEDIVKMRKAALLRYNKSSIKNLVVV